MNKNSLCTWRWDVLQAAWRAMCERGPVLINLQSCVLLRFCHQICLFH